MPKHQFTEEEVPQFEMLKPGDYCFEVAGFESGISNKGRTNGCETVTVKVKFFTDRTFSKPMAQWSERLTFPQTRDKELNQFLGGLLNMFKKCTNMHGNVGEEVEFTEGTVLGLRGVAKVKQEKRSDNGEMTNRVDRWLTDKEKFPRVVKFEDDDDKPF